MTPEEWREQVGRHIEARRNALGLSSRYLAVEGLDLSESWWRAMEVGGVRRNDGQMSTPNPRGSKVRALTERLKWPPDAITRLLDGEDPSTFRPPLPEPESIELASRLNQLPEHAKRTILSIIEAEEAKLRS